MRPLLVALASSFLACGPLVVGELVAPEVCQDFDPIAIDAAPHPISGTFERAVQVQIPQEFRDKAAEAQADVDVSLLRVELSAEGVPDLSFIDAADATLIREETATLLASYARPVTAPSSITLSPPEGLDISSVAAQATEVSLLTSVTGTLPTVPWTLKLRGCYRAQVALEWSPE